MKIRDPEAYERYQEKWEDPYGAAVLSYAERWANLMESEMAARPLEEIAGRLSHEADEEGLTGNMYGMAVLFLATCWEHGEALRNWHNREYGQPECAGVVNPAIITIKLPDDAP